MASSQDHRPVANDVMVRDQFVFGNSRCSMESREVESRAVHGRKGGNFFGVNEEMVIWASLDHQVPRETQAL